MQRKLAYRKKILPKFLEFRELGLKVLRDVNFVNYLSIDFKCQKKKVKNQLLAMITVVSIITIGLFTEKLFLSQAIADENKINVGFYLKSVNSHIEFFPPSQKSVNHGHFEFLAKIKIINIYDSDMYQDVSGKPPPAYIINFNIEGLKEGSIDEGLKEGSIERLEQKNIYRAFLGYRTTRGLMQPLLDFDGKEFVIATYMIDDGSRWLYPF